MKILGVLVAVFGFGFYTFGKELLEPEVPLKTIKVGTEPSYKGQVLKFEFWPDEARFQMIEEDDRGNWKLLEVRDGEPEQLRLTGFRDQVGNSTLTGFEEEPFLWEDEAKIKCKIAEMLESDQHVSGVFLISSKCRILFDIEE